MKKLFKVLIGFVVMFILSNNVMAYTHKSSCFGMKANNYTCEYNELQRVYSIVKGVTLGEENNKLYSIKYEEGEEIAACYVEYTDEEKTNFKGYFFNILPKFTKTNDTAYGNTNYSESEVNAYYHSSNDFYVIEDWSPKHGIFHDELYAVVRFESSWKNKSSDKICPKYAAFYPYYLPRTSTGFSIQGGEIQFSNILSGVTDLDFDKDTTKKSLLCISKDNVIEKKINSYFKKIKENVIQTFNANSEIGINSDIESVKNTVLEANKSDREAIESELSELINPQNKNDGTLYCKSYIENLKNNVYSNEILKSTIEDAIYYSAVDKCVGENSTPGKYLSNATNYGYYKLGKKNAAQTQNPDYAKLLRDYLKGAPEITSSQVSCIANYLNMASEIAEEEEKGLSNLINSTADEMNAARAWLDKGLEGPNIDPSDLTCEEMLGTNLTKILKFALEALSIAGAIIAIVNSMISLIPALIAKDSEALKKAQKKCVTMAIVLVLILLLPTLLTFIGNIFGYDLTCFNWMK